MLCFTRAVLPFAWVDRGERAITVAHAIVEDTAFFPAPAVSLTIARARRSSTTGGARPVTRSRSSFEVEIRGEPCDRAPLGVVFEPVAGLGSLELSR